MAKTKLFRWLRRALVLLAFGAVAAWVGLEWATSRASLPDELFRPAQGTTLILDADGGVLQEESGVQARSQVLLRAGEFGPWLPEITMLLEDHRFREHRGVDWRAAGGALWSNARGAKARRGASTITQQLIKLAGEHRDRSWSAKAGEALGARKLERVWSKETILAAYLNRLDYGNRRIGPESAARAYFGKACQDLTLGEAIFLAGLPQSPARFNPWSAPEQAEAKYDRSIARLRALAFLSPEQAKSLAEHPPKTGRFTPPNRHPRFVEAMRRDEPDASGLARTTLRPAIQEAAERILGGHLNGLNRHDVRNGALVVLDNASGSVVALASASAASALDEAAINAALIPRHAGSTLKPLVYQQAIEERRLTAASLLADTAESLAKHYPDYDPKNFNQRYHGPVRTRVALANSLNVSAILAARLVGPRRAFERLREWGLRPAEGFDRYGVGFVLGNAQVRLTDLALAYSGLARGGVAGERLGWLSARPPAMKPVADRAACAILEDILCDNAARAMAFGPRSNLDLGPKYRTAVKTGTSSSFRDAWVVGYNRDYTVATWIGNLNGSPMNSALSADVAGPVWRQMMLELYERHAAKPLASPVESAALVRRDVCALSGLLPCAASPRVIGEWFLAGTEPTASANSFFRDGQIILPTEYADWVKSEHNHLHAIVEDAGQPKDLPFRILSPAPLGRYWLDPALPAAQQKLALRSDHPHPERLVWTVGEERIAGHPASWPLRPGRWKAIATDPDTGVNLAVQFTVEGL